MDKQPNSRNTGQFRSNFYLGPDPGGSTSVAGGQEEQHPIAKVKTGWHVLISWGLIPLQILAMLLILAILSPAEQTTDDQNAGAAFDTSLLIQVQPTQEQPASDDSLEISSDSTVFDDAADNNSLVVPNDEPVQPEPSSLWIRGLEITQGIQVFNEPENARCNPDPGHPDHIFCNNSIPLVAGRHTLVRLYLACNGSCPTSETGVRLRLLKEGVEQATLTRQLPAATLQRVNGLSLPELRLQPDNSVNFEFLPPPEWLSGQITFEVEAASEREVPAMQTLTKNFAARKPLRVAYVPIQYQGIMPSIPEDVDHWLLRMYPIPAIEYYRLPVPDVIWEGELSKTEVLRRLLYIYWLYAQNQPLEAWPDQLFGWLPQEVYNGGTSDPFWCPGCAGPHSSRVAFGGLRPEQDIGGPRILVHEIAHNLGAQHAWSPTQSEDSYCFRAEGVDIQVDPQWPYAHRPNIQEFGIDLYSNPSVIYPPYFYDMMAYCTLPWISPHTYRKIFDSPFLQPDAAALPLADFKPQVEANDNGTLLVSGVIYPDGTVSQPEIIRLEGDSSAAFNPSVAFTPPPGDDYCLDVEGDNNTSLARHCFDAGFLDLETGLSTDPSPFFFTLPDVDAAEVAKVSVSKNEVALVVVTPSNAPPDVTVTFPNGGEVLAGQQTLTWQAGDADDDPLQYDLLYSPDRGQSWLPLAVRLSQTNYTFYTDQLPASDQALIRVIANDGFNTNVDETDAPFTIEPPLQNSLSLHGPATVKPGQRFDVSVVAHRVTAPGLFGVQLKLDFDPALLQADRIHLHPDLTLVVAESLDNQAGQVSIVASRQGRVPDLTGNITLATLTFTALQDTGQADLYLSEVMAGAHGGQQLDVPEIRGLSLRIVE